MELKSVGGVAYLTADEMAEADRAAIEDFGVDVISLMENAGMQTARLARRMLLGGLEKKKVCILVGKGNNGGDGLVAARHLSNWGAEVTVVLGGKREELRDVPARQLRSVDKIGIKVVDYKTETPGAELLVDALLGYNSRGDPREPIAGIIRRANDSKTRTLAVDVPSGLDATTGAPGDPCIVAEATVTFGLPKTGFLATAARGFVGELYVADISMPEAVYERFSQPRGLFGSDTLVRVL